jgi:hypothetical protein
VALDEKSGGTELRETEEDGRLYGSCHVPVGNERLPECSAVLLSVVRECN